MGRTREGHRTDSEACVKRGHPLDSLDADIRDHLEREADENIARGMTPDEARQAALRTFGSVTLAKESTREVWVPRWLQGLGQDIRLSFRSLRATPIVTAVAIASLALGVGANTAIFSIINSLSLRALPVSDPTRLVLLANGTPGTSAFNYPVWDEIRRRSDPFNSVAAWAPASFNLAASGETQLVDGVWASGGFFETIGVRAFVGRTFSDADDKSDGGPEGPVAVISYNFWMRHFGGVADVLGRTLPLDGIPFTIIGVTPPAFFGMEVGRTFDVVAPLENNHGTRGANVSWLRIVGRLKPGETIATATAFLRARQPEIRDATLPATATASFRKVYLQVPFEVIPGGTGSSALRRQYERSLVAIIIVAGLVVLIASANIANLLLARAAARRHEFAVRMALGASRWRLARQVLMESVVLAIGGTAVGLFVASWGSRAMVQALSFHADVQRATVFLDLSLDWHVLIFTLVLTCATVLVFGAAPALRASAVASSDVLTHGRGSVADARTGFSSGLVITQVAMSLVLVVAAGLFVRTFVSLLDLPLGFAPEQLLVVTVKADHAATALDARQRIFDLALGAVRAIPGVADAGASVVTPVSGQSFGNQVEVAGTPPRPDNDRGAFVNHVSPGWLRTLGTQLRSGRDFTDADHQGGQSVAIVNETFARKFLGGSSPLGRAVTGIGDAPVEIVGVAADAVYRSLRDPIPATVYLPFARSREAAQFGMNLTIRSRGDSPQRLLKEIEAALAATNPRLTWTARPLVDQVDGSLAQEHLLATLSGFFGVLALLLGGLGLYGVTSYSVSRRRREIGIRMAVGADPLGIVRLVMSRTFTLVIAGILVGTVGSVWASKFVASLLWGLQPRDPATLVGSALLLILVATIAAGVPALRASRIDPALVLRNE